MSDLATQLEQIEQGQAQKEVTANNLFDAASPAMMYGRHAEACGGLTWGYYGGRWNGAAIANGTVLLPGGETSRLVVDRATGALILDTASDDLWADIDGYAHAYEIDTSGVAIIDYRDHRGGASGVGGGGGSGTVSSVAATVPAFLSVAGSPITAAGTLAISYSGTALPIANGGTGGTSQSAARAALGLAIGADVQAYDPDLAALAAIAGGAQGDILYHNGTAWARLAAGTAGQVLRTAGAGANPAWGSPVESVKVACSDEISPISAGTAKTTFRMPYAFTVTEVRASLTTAQTSGSIFTVDINESGASILSTKLTIDNTEKTSTTAAAAPVISDAALADDAEITVDVDQIGSGTAAGLKIYIIGRKA